MSEIKQEKVRKVFLDNLPRWGKNSEKCKARKGSIKWKECVGLSVKFIYDDTIGNIEIVDIDNKKKLTVKYKDKKYKIFTDGLINAKITNIIFPKLPIKETHPDLVKYFYNKNDAENYTFQSNKKIKMICPDCGCVKDMVICNLYNQGFGCTECGDGVSYPEKYVISVLNQLNIKFESQKTFKWSTKISNDIHRRIYDIYIESLNLIIEVNGNYHYKETKIGNKSIDEIRLNDAYKKELALQNNIKYYIELDCEKSNSKYIKENILNSKLAELFDLNNIDWKKCEEYSLCNLVKEACNYWNNGIKSTTEIGGKMGLISQTISKYLKQGAKFGWCDYSVETSEAYRQAKLSKLNKERCGKSVMCVETGQVFDSISELCDESMHMFGVKFYSGNISRVCKGTRPHSHGYTFRYVEEGVSVAI